jgi:uncharacterized protein
MLHHTQPVYRLLSRWLLSRWLLSRKPDRRLLVPLMLATGFAVATPSHHSYAQPTSQPPLATPTDTPQPTTQPQPTTPPQAPETDDASSRRSLRQERARASVEALQQGDSASAVQHFDATMARLLPPDKLQATWLGLTSQFGPLQEIAEIEHTEVKGEPLLLVKCVFQRTRFYARFAFDNEARISGLYFSPADRYQSPSYARPQATIEREVTIGKGLFKLSGTLTLPKTDRPVPAVVLVHGSGPHDRDESIGPNKPFRDLSDGLTARGVAVLRYEKRTKQHPLALTVVTRQLTVQEETIADAVAAVELLREADGILPERIFLLGHSLGGYLIPRIATSTPHPAGYISLAGSSRPLEELIRQQTRYLLEADGELSPDDEQALAELEQQIVRAQAPDLSPQVLASQLPLSIPAGYWLDLRDYDPAEMAKSIPQPLLLLQGLRDYQVTQADWDRWQAALGNKPTATFKAYPDLNHLFIPGSGPSLPAEYLNAGNVAETVIDDIAAWILAQ